jgi:hypothetical protein
VSALALIGVPLAVALAGCLAGSLTSPSADSLFARPRTQRAWSTQQWRRELAVRAGLASLRALGESSAAKAPPKT